MVKLDNLKTVTMTDSFENESTTVKHPSAALDTDVQVPTGLKQPDLDGNARDLAYEELKKTQKETSVFGYLYSEVTRGYMLEHDEAKFTEKRKRVYTFMKIPRELEKFMVYGFFQCLDAFLYVFTLLPLRFLIGLVKLSIYGCLPPWWKKGRILEPAQLCDLLKGFILIACVFMMDYIDVSMMYHIVRGQAIIKLYIFFNMLEVIDRLFSSFGQDTLDSLFWTAAEPRGRKREHIGLLPHLGLSVIYVFLHTILVLFQATTLNVAFNSHNKALITIMMSNNFVELKGSVFKKFEKNNLFQMSCSDVRERFHFLTLLSIVCVRNLTEFSWNLDHLWVLIPDVLMVLFTEFLVDWVKHAFITKFNEIPFEVYREYTVSIAYDLAASRHKNAFSDHLDVVSRRMGFIPLPLAVLLIRVIGQSLNISTALDIVLLFLFYLCLMSLKVLISIVLAGKAIEYIAEHKERERAEEEERKSKQQILTKRKSSWDPSYSAHKVSELTRSKSVGSRLNQTGHKRQHSDDAGVKAALSVDKDLTVEDIAANLSPPLTATKPLLSNSTVSLRSVSLNEEMMKDKAKSVNAKENSPQHVRHRTHCERQRTTSESKTPKKDIPLHDIDRYDMCSNRII